MRGAERTGPRHTEGSGVYTTLSDAAFHSPILSLQFLNEARALGNRATTPTHESQSLPRGKGFLWKVHRKSRRELSEGKGWGGVSMGNSCWRPMHKPLTPVWPFFLLISPWNKHKWGIRRDHSWKSESRCAYMLVTCLVTRLSSREACDIQNRLIWLFLSLKTVYFCLYVWMFWLHVCRCTCAEKIRRGCPASRTWSYRGLGAAVGELAVAFPWWASSHHLSIGFKRVIYSCCSPGHKFHTFNLSFI